VSTDEERSALTKIEEGLVRAVEEYTGNPAISFAVSSIPIFGPIIDIIVQTAGSKISERRFMQLCTSLKAEIALIDETKIDKPFLESEEGYDIIRKTFHTALETAENEKIRLYARILVRAAMLDNARFRHSAKDFLSILLELNPADLTLARTFYQQQKDTPPDIDHKVHNELHVVKQSGYDTLKTTCKMNNAEFDLSLNKLIRAGLIRQVVGSYIGYIGDAHRITHTFRTLMQLLETLD
jgi:hypothetical protein